MNQWDRNSLKKFHTNDSYVVGLKYWSFNPIICRFWEKHGYAFDRLTIPARKTQQTYLIIAVVFLFFFTIIIAWQSALLILLCLRKREMKRLYRVFTQLDDFEEFTTYGHDHEQAPEPLAIQCKSLCFSSKGKRLISDLYVDYIPGSMTAIMGPSGNVKLNVIF